MNIFYKISIDHVNFNYISGWCHHRFFKERVIVLQLFLDNRLIAETTCDRFREDLKALQVHPTGKCGFAFAVDTDGRIQAGAVFAIRVKGSRRPLVQLPSPGSAAGSGSALRRRNIWRLKRRRVHQAVVFMHIPKTAGTSFNTLAQTLFPKGSTISHIELIAADRYPALNQNYRYISGHLRYGLLKQHFDQEHHAFYAIVREPYTQLHSHLKWMIQTVKNPDDNFFKMTNQVIYRLGLKLAGIDFASPGSLAQFVGSLDDLEAAFLDNAQTRYFLNEQVLRVQDNDLETALYNASQFRLVGITEHYDDFVHRFKTINGIDVDENLQHMNISKSANLFNYHDESIRKTLKPLVSLDLKLYAHLAHGKIIDS